MKSLAALALIALAGAASADTLVAARLLRPATVLGPSDVAVIEASVPGALDGAAEIVGLEARVTIYPGRPIRQEDIGPAALVERNQIVTLVFSRGGLSILAEGRALSRGAAGERVRAMNLASRTTITGRVTETGAIAVGPAGELLP